MFDCHVHSNYSDGAFLGRMVAAAEAAGLDGVGFADHCNVSDREYGRRHARRFGFNLDLTAERRRAAIEGIRAETDLRVFDAVEVDYHPADEDAIRAFLDAADFEYAIGSVHELRGTNVHEDAFTDLPKSERRAVVDEYFNRLVALVESDIFDVLAHADVVERNPALRGYATDEQYRRVAAALADTGTVTEINAGRVDREYGAFHPAPGFLAALADAGVPVTLGTDAHAPAELRERVPLLREKAAAAPVEVVDGHPARPGG